MNQSFEFLQDKAAIYSAAILIFVIICFMLFSNKKRKPVYYIFPIYKEKWLFQLIEILLMSFTVYLYVVMGGIKSGLIYISLLILIVWIIQWIFYFIIKVSIRFYKTVKLYEESIFIVDILVPLLVLTVLKSNRNSDMIKLISLVVLLVSIASIITLLRHMIDLVFNDNYVKNIVSDFYMISENYDIPLKRMKFQIIVNEFINIIFHYSILVYYLSNMSDWKEFKMGSELLDALYYVVITFSTVGYGDITPNTTLETIISIIITCTGMFFTGCFIGTLIDKGNDELDRIRINTIDKSKEKLMAINMKSVKRNV